MTKGEGMQVQEEHVKMAHEEAQKRPTIANKPVLSRGEESVPVVRVWSVIGLEYAFMTFMLLSVVISINWFVVALINGSTGFTKLSGPLALLIVSLPVLAYLFLRLKKAELADQSLKIESSRRRFTQRVQVLAFLISFFSALSIVSTLISSLGGDKKDLGKTLATAATFLVIWGALFTYFWVDEHRRAR